MPNAFRKATAILLVTLAALLAGAPPAHANPYHARRGSEEPARVQPARSFLLSVLLEIFELAGGAMDPNGKS